MKTNLKNILKAGSILALYFIAFMATVLLCSEYVLRTFTRLMNVLVHLIFFLYCYHAAKYLGHTWNKLCTKYKLNEFVK